MKITKAEIYKLKLPLKEPFRISVHTMTYREIIFVKLYSDNGIVAVGESAHLEEPCYEPDFNDGSIILMKNHLLPSILHKEIVDIEDLEKMYANIRGNNFAKAALEAAFWHYKMQKENNPLDKIWGGVKSKIPVAISIGLGENLQDSIERVKRYINEHQPERAKIKIKPGIDTELIKSIRQNYPNLPLMVDANASFTIKNLEVFKELDKYNLLMIEQPLQYNDIVDHAELQKQISTPICLDESVTNYHSAEQALKIGACKIVNIKPQRVGGYWQAKRISELCAKHEVPVWCGGMVESGWGQLFNCAIATLPNYNYENDICLSKWYLSDDILEDPIEEVDGIINVEQTRDLFIINEKRFKKYTTSKILVE